MSSRSKSRSNSHRRRSRRSRRSGAGENENANANAWTWAALIRGIEDYVKVEETTTPEDYVGSAVHTGRLLRRDVVLGMFRNPMVVAGISLGAMSALVAIMGLRRYWPEIKNAFLRSKNEIADREFKQNHSAKPSAGRKNNTKKRTHRRN